MNRIEVVDYDPLWQDDFLQERALISQLLEHAHLGIHHIGGTAVPGLPARAEIDILVEITHLDAFDMVSHKMQAAGYSPTEIFAAHTGRFFGKQRPHGAFQVFVYPIGEMSIARHLAIRDCLRGDDVLATEYGIFKHAIAKKYRFNPDQYALEKSAYLSSMESAALDRLFPVVA